MNSLPITESECERNMVVNKITNKELINKVGIIGLGSVGSALFKHLSNFYNVCGYDIIGNYNWDDILKCPVLFICVQTPGDSNGRLDCSHVEDALHKLASSNYSGVIIIKSTLGIGFMENATGKFPGLRMVYSPEFLREKSALEWTANPDRLVFSGEEDNVTEALKIYSWATCVDIIITDYRSAEIGKLAHNAFIATKVSFTNTMENIAARGKGNIDDIMKIVYTDRRVRNMAHLTPHLGAFGGKCVPKDTMELMNAFSSESLLFKADFVVNETVKTSMKNSTTGQGMPDSDKYGEQR